jgi:hypothetical protein
MPPEPAQGGAGNKKLVIILGTVAAVFGLATIGMGGYFLTREPPKVASNDTSSNQSAQNDSDKASSDKKGDGKQEAKGGEEKSDDKKAEQDDKNDDKEEDNAKKDTSGKASDQKVASARGSLHLPKGSSKSSSGSQKSSSKSSDKAKKPEKKPDKAEEKPVEKKPAGKFSRSAALSALQAAAGAASGCKKPGGPTGRGRVSVTFAPSGRVTTAVVTGPPFSGTSVGGCVAAVFRRARVPPFTGSPVTAHKSFTIR